MLIPPRPSSFLTIALATSATIACVAADPVSSEQEALTATSYAAVAAGDAHSLALRSDGLVFAAGDNFAGQLGNGTTHATGTGAPTLVTGLGQVTAIAAGCSHSLALRSDGTVWAWGNNSSGQLGIGTLLNQTTPVQVSVSGVAFQAIGAGCFHSLAIDTSGIVWTWGLDSQGQLGNGAASSTPTPVALTTVASAVDGGDEFSLALGPPTNLRVRATGRNDNGQFGNGNTTPSQVLIAGNPRTGIGEMAAGSAHGISIGSGGVFAWGSNASCALGPAANGASFSTTPVMVTNSFGFAGHLSAGRFYSLATMSSGFGGGPIVVGWGRNDAGQLGIGATSAQNCFVTTAARFANGGQVVPSTARGAIAAGARHALVVDSTGHVLAWGANSLGQLAIGTTATAVWATPTMFP